MTSNTDAGTILAFLNCVCRNDGRSPAWITEKGICAKLVNVIPKEPDFSDIEVFQREVQPIGAGQKDEHLLQKSCAGTEEDRLRTTFLLYGRVKYRTIFGKDAETRFGYVITHGDHLERLPAEYPEYNEYV